MDFKEMNFNWFKSEIENLNFSKPDTNQSYQLSYPYLIKYFKDFHSLNEDNLIIGAHAVYGWMPTILNLTKNEDITDSVKVKFDKEIKAFNKAKNGENLNQKDLGQLKSRINNSIVGLSKLLHFVNPEKYAIWDSKIFKFIRNKNTVYGINKPRYYLEYLEGCKEIAGDRRFSDFRNNNSFSFENKGAYSDVILSDFRYIELALFKVASLKVK